jgi:type IV pilus assembly protein PilN
MKGYILINLLPYRDKIKKEQIRQFSLLMIIFAAVAIFINSILYSILILETDAQNSRNEYIINKNKKLDEDIKAIAGLRDEIKATLAKRKVVENLQANNSDSVNILNNIATQLPDGMALKNVSEKDNKITIIGNTLSNNKVSTYITNLISTDFFTNPELVEIKSIQIQSKKQNAKVKDDQNISEFTLNVYIKQKDDEEKTEQTRKPKIENKDLKGKQ